MEIEHLDCVLKHKNIERIECQKGIGDEYFERKRKFVIAGETYQITWYRNTSYLEHRNLTIPFDSVKQSGTWPNNKKTNLQFYNSKLETCCILPIFV